MKTTPPKKVRAALVAIAAAATATVCLAPSASAISIPEESTQTQMCTTILGKPDPITRTAPITSVTCTTDPIAAQKSGRVAAAASSVLLIRFWEHANYTGYNNSVYGEPCNSSGYGISNMFSLSWYPGSQPHNFTSYRVFNGCNQVSLFMNTNYGGTASGWRTGDSANVGNPYNDWWGSTLFRRL